MLYQAADARIPLLERVRFLAIAESNLDEFFRKRVGGLKRQRDAGVRQLSPDGRSPGEQLELIRDAVTTMKLEMEGIWESQLRSGLRTEAGIAIVRYHQLSRTERRRLDAYFSSSIRPLLSPMQMPWGGTFPLISNLTLSLALVLRHGRDGTFSFARIKVPVEHGRWIPLEGDGRVLPLEALIAHHAHAVFPEHSVESVHVFRLTRNADLRRDEEEAEDLLQMISEELRERRSASVVRLEVEQGTPASVVELLCEELKLGRDDVYRVRGLLDLSALSALAALSVMADAARIRSVHRPDLLFEPWEPVVPLAFARIAASPRTESSPHIAASPHDATGDNPFPIFEVLRRENVLVHHPYDSFACSVQRFLEQAAEDPSVTEIRQTLYRTSEDSPVIRALIRAAQLGKTVEVLVEVTARFEEEKNIARGQLLERGGVKVNYGILGLKTHAKTLLVTREEADGPRLYGHIGTGNYHVLTATLYSDVGFFTADPVICRDLATLFADLRGDVRKPEYHALVVAPGAMRKDFEERIEREIEVARSGDGGRIIAKMNALDDERMIRALYRASMAGVKIDLIVRGHTRLRPGLRGVSENIRVVSIIGRFLEHDRIYWFRNGGSPEILVGSADWRRRNLEERVEVIVRIRDEPSRARMTEVLELALVDNRLAWDLDSTGRYRLRKRKPGGVVLNYQEALMNLAEARTRDTP